MDQWKERYSQYICRLRYSVLHSCICKLSYIYCSGVRNITGVTLFFPQFWTYLNESWQDDGPWDPNIELICPSHKGAIIFYLEGGGRLSVMAGRQFFLVPPFAYGKKFWSPPLPTVKNFGPLLWPREKILVPPPKVKEHALRINK